MFIKFYAPDSKLYPSKAVDFDEYRSWADVQLASKYANHEISVLIDDSDSQVITDDESILSELQVFCSKLWIAWYENNT